MTGRHRVFIYGVGMKRGQLVQGHPAAENATQGSSLTLVIVHCPDLPEGQPLRQQQ